MRDRVVRIAGALLALGAVFWIVSRFIETDEDRIEQLVEDMRSAAEASDAEMLMSFVTQDVTWQQLDQEALSRRVRSVLKDMPPKAVSAEVTDLEIDDDRATGSVVVLYRSQKLPSVWRVTFRVTFGRRDERWRVTAVEPKM